MKIEVGPTGKVVKGTVFDVNKDSLEAAIRRYDPQLYITWNPDKQRGWGMWEIRRRPNQKTLVRAGVFEGNTYCDLKYVEKDVENHVIDLPSLSYEVLTWLKKADMWQVKNYALALEEYEREFRERGEKQARQEMLYHMKQIRSQMQGFRELVLSGANPALLAKYWGSSGKE